MATRGGFDKFWYELWRGICMYATGFGLGLRSEGAHNIPASGPVLVIANHESFLDPVLIGIAARPRHLCFLARKTLFRNPIFGWHIRKLNAVPINQEGFAREGLQTILNELHNGQAVLVFPEGERTPDGAMQPFRSGVHLLIRRVKMPVVPVGVTGAYEAWPRWRPYPILAPFFAPDAAGRVAVSFGKPLDGRVLAEMPREQVLRQLFDAVQAQVRRAERLAHPKWARSHASSRDGASAVSRSR